MQRVVLTYDVDSVELLPGETLIGRGLHCQIRFNDPAVSRVHLRIVVNDSGVLGEDLSSTNGSSLNGKRIQGQAPLKNGDVLEVGYRKLKIQLLSELADDPEADEQTLTEENEWEMGGEEAPAPVDEDSLEPILSEQVTINRPDAWLESAAKHPRMEDPLAHHCPRCRISVPYAQDNCPNCGYLWPEGRPVSTTQKIRLAEIARRQAPRHVVHIPVLYSSDSLTFDGLARDVGEGGMFIATELLDPIGTSCVITILPDGAAALRVQGEVCRIVQTHQTVQGKPAGMAVRFREMNADVQRWLDHLATAHG